MKKNYDVIIIGSGPGGLILGDFLFKNNIDFILIDKGKSIKERVCINNCHKCVNDNCAIINGVGGAGFFSDGKLNFSYDIGGDTSKVFSKECYDSSIKYIINRFNLLVKKPLVHEIENFNKKNSSICRMVSVEQSHIGSDKLSDFIESLTNDFKHLIVTDKTVMSITDFRGNFKVHLNDDCLTSKIVVVATGQSGSCFAVDTAIKNNVTVSKGIADIGIRVEVPSEYFNQLIKLQYDPKIYFNDSLTVRTFCTNPNGYIATENKGDYVSVNGYANSGNESGMTNFALMCSIPDLDNPREFTETICKEISLFNNHKLILEDINFFKINSCLNNFFPKKVMNVLINAINSIELIIGEELKGVIYAPEVKLYNNNIHVKFDSFESSKNNLFFIGDCVGFIHGITNACVSGLIAGKSIVNQISSERTIKSLSWNEYNLLINDIKNSLISRKLKPNVIFGISRGGLIPAVNFAHLFDCKEVGVINLKKNDSDDFFEINKQKYPVLNDSILPAFSEGLIMIVDDIIGYGETMTEAFNLIKKSYPKSRIIRVAIVANLERLNEKGINPKSIVDFYSLTSNKKTWIIFPWEKND